VSASGPYLSVLTGISLPNCTLCTQENTEAGHSQKKIEFGCIFYTFLGFDNRNGFNWEV